MYSRKLTPFDLRIKLGAFLLVTGPLPTYYHGNSALFTNPLSPIGSNIMSYWSLGAATVVWDRLLKATILSSSDKIKKQVNL